MEVAGAYSGQNSGQDYAVRLHFTSRQVLTVMQERIDVGAYL